MGSAVPKQYLPLAGRPVLSHTLQALQASPAVSAIVLVVHPEDDALYRQALGVTPPTKLRQVVPGGDERWASVRAGLAVTTSADAYVAVHDAVRPLASADLLARVVAAAVAEGAAVPGLPVAETVKQVHHGRVVATPDRSGMWLAQTPQVFRRELLLAAYEGAAEPVPTDDASLVERLGHAVAVVAGEPANIKVTTPNDLAWAAWQLDRARGTGAMPRRLRVGQGYDVHRLAPDRRLILGGVSVPFDRGLAGHSDADVLTHAIIDALLGAAGVGDIGQLFPDSDDQYRGIDSLVLLRRTTDLLLARGAVIHHVDAVVMAQRPRLAPHRQAMAAALAAAMQVAADVVSVKATTTEGLGFTGREEGIAAQAVALVEL